MAIFPKGMRLVVLQVLEGWLMVEFEMEWGRRVGYVEQSLVTPVER